MSNRKGGELEEQGLECLTAKAENLKSILLAKAENLKSKGLNV